MTGSPWGLAFAAGMLAAVNPCGFALLPAYLSFLVLDKEVPGRHAAVRRAVVLTGAMTLGFVGLFGLFGLVIAPIAGSLQQHVPWFTIVLGLGLVLLGGWLLAGRSLPTLRIGRVSTGGAPITGSFVSMFGFGISYALTSLGCSSPPFIGIVVSAFQTDSIWNGIGLFLLYALGMGTLVGIAAVAVALASTSVVTRLRRLGAWMPRLAGGLFVLVGLYVAYYGWYELRSFSGADVSGDPIIATAERIQSWIASLLPH